MDSVGLSLHSVKLASHRFTASFPRTSLISG
ncbi:Uncharacterised protein [Vibrio cholerae]|nr:Uncharacterised protein [Vibrio cholerae]